LKKKGSLTLKITTIDPTKPTNNNLNEDATCNVSKRFLVIISDAEDKEIGIDVDHLKNNIRFVWLERKLITNQLAKRIS
jgi:hypothetical protein